MKLRKKESSNSVSPENLIEFTNLLMRLDTTEFAGVTTMLKIPITTQKKEDEKIEVRPFEEILSDIIDEYLTLNHRQRRNLLKIIKQVGKENK